MPRSTSNPRQGPWRLQDAKARLSEVVRMAREQGPQRVTIHGKDAVVIIDAAAYDRRNEPGSGADVLAAIAACPVADDFDLERQSTFPPVRDINL